MEDEWWRPFLRTSKTLINCDKYLHIQYSLFILLEQTATIFCNARLTKVKELASRLKLQDFVCLLGKKTVKLPSLLATPTPWTSWPTLQ